MLFDNILPRVELLPKLESILSLSYKFIQYSKYFVVASTIFTASSPGLDSVLRNHFLGAPGWLSGL